MSQGVEEWSGVDHQDVLKCPQPQSEGEVTSDIGDSNNRDGPREVNPDHTPVISSEKSRP